MTDNRVTVIVAAYGAEKTVGAAVASALALPETAEVIVVDDASKDSTADAARSADDGSARLSVIVQPENRGPSAARNLALLRARADYIAILDADDMLVPGRFGAMFAQGGWDIIADDIQFVATAPDRLPLLPFGDAPRNRLLTFEEFVARNISAPGRQRAELGFLKPVISRHFIERHGLRYDETMRLGEDFIFYARALAAGARFRLIDHCGYVAVQHANSLSGRHATNDLLALHRSSLALAELPSLNSAEQELLRVHARQIAVKARYRQMLEDRHEYGPVRALARLLTEPSIAGPVLGAYIHDRRSTRSIDITPTRQLFGPDEFL